MNSLLPAIEQYIQEKKPDYAVMVEGPWGCGKTYYWKNTVIPFIIDKYSQKENKITPVYVSLFGADYEKSVRRITFNTALGVVKKNSIIERIANRISGKKSLKDGKVGKILEPISRLFSNQGWYRNSEDAALSLLSGFNGNILICIDDIERSLLVPTEFFGLVNLLVEQYGIHVVALCNERGSISENTHENDAYSRQKEKCFSASYKFQENEDEVIAAIISKITDHFSQEWAIQNKTQICNTFSRIDLHNYRIIRRIIHSFSSSVFPVWNSLTPAQKDTEKLRHAFTFLSACFVELGMNACKKNEFSSIKEYENILRASIFQSMSGNHEKNSKSEESVFVEKFFLKYHGKLPGYDYKGIAWFDSLFSFFLDGFLDIELLKKEISIQTEILDEPDRSLTLLNGWFYGISDSEFQRALCVSWDALRNGSIKDPNIFLRLFRSIMFISKNNMANISEDEVLDEFRKNLETSCSRISEDFEFSYPFSLEYTSGVEKEIFTEIKSEIENQKKKYRKSKLITSIENLGYGSMGFFDLLKIYGSGLTPILDKECAHMLGAKIPDMTNGIIDELYQTIRYRYSASNIFDYLSEERSFLSEFLAFVESETAKLPVSLRKGLLSLLAQVLTSPLSKREPDE